MRAPILTSTLVLWAAAAAGAQQAVQRQQPDQAIRMQRMQESMIQVDRMMTDLRRMNEWMTGTHACDACVEMGTRMERTGEQLRSMFQQLEQLHKDPHLLADPARMHDLDALHDRQREMVRQLDRALEALLKLAGG